MLHALYAGSYLSFLKPNSLLAGTYTTLERNKWLHSSPATAPKCQAIKRVFFTSIYPTLIVNLGTICYLKEFT